MLRIDLLDCLMPMITFFKKWKNMSSKRTPNYDVCKTSVVNRIDKNQPVKRKRMEENEIEFDSSNQKKRVRLDICIPC